MLGFIKKMIGTKSDKDIKLVLLMDEVDQLNSYNPRVNQRLRSLFMRDFSERLVAVVSGVAINGATSMLAPKTNRSCRLVKLRLGIE